jgi:single-stranded-DNA-specific exonuclease
VLSVRGIEGEAVAPFLEPKLTMLHDPSLMPDLDKAAQRLLRAARGGEKVVIYGDYDVDGVTATAILRHTLKQIEPGAVVDSYIPHRLEEGYGLNTGAIEELARQGAGVIVSVDCGVTAIEPAAAARRAGVDLIITDHHNPPASDADLPDAFAVVHPRRPGSAYPFADLSGSGVAYKLAWRLATMAGGASRVDGAMRALLIELLAFAALGAIADVVPLQGENRVIARHGLHRIKHSPIIGLRALVEASGLAGERVDAWDVAFRLAPRLNASGRMSHARDAVELFTTDNPERAKTIAEALTEQNNQRRTVERQIFEQAAEAAVKAGMDRPDRRAIVLADPRWHAGVVGIVCSRLVERFGRPAILLCDDGESLHGSGRSIDGFNLHGALESCAGMLAKFGGHDMAAGLRLDRGRMDEFVAAFTGVANERISEDELLPKVEIDCPATLDELTPVNVRRLESLGPFGRGNPPVTLLLASLKLDAPATPMGKGGEHVAMHVQQAGSARTLRLVGWGWGERRQALTRGQRIDAVVRPKVSTYGGRESVEPELVDFRLGS